MTRSAWVLALMGGIGLAGAGFWSAEAQERVPAGPSNTEVLVMRILKQQVSALNVESADAVMMCFHAEAPDREGMRKVLVNQFRVRDLRYKVKSAKFIGEDGRYAYVRTWQIVDGQNEKTPFLGETEELLVFRKGARGWRAWTSARLDKKGLPLPGPGPKAPKGPRRPGGGR